MFTRFAHLFQDRIFMFLDILQAEGHPSISRFEDEINQNVFCCAT
ncbi:hypothetical protein H1R20_g324, partial [Candolleomyces eurysporus]